MWHPPLKKKMNKTSLQCQNVELIFKGAGLWGPIREYSAYRPDAGSSCRRSRSVICLPLQSQEHCRGWSSAICFQRAFFIQLIRIYFLK